MVAQLVKKLTVFMEPKGSLSCSQEPTCLYPERVESNWACGYPVVHLHCAVLLHCHEIVLIVC
jgi:hypothetical protein